MKIPIITVNATLKFPTKRKTIFTTVSYTNKVTKGKTKEEAFKFLRVPNKDKCVSYEIECISVVGDTGVVDS